MTRAVRLGQMTRLVLIVVLLSVCWIRESCSLLYPRENSVRDVRRLDGVWKFKVAPIEDYSKGFVDGWYKDAWNELNLDYEPMPVPASFNDITQRPQLRDHVGYVWYQRTFFVPTAWRQKRVVLYFGSVHYDTIVFVNGQRVTTHSGGHLPFEAVINQALGDPTKPNVLTVAINNTLTLDTIPQGDIVLKRNDPNYPPFFYKNIGNFDFFNYAGIHRGVFLYATESTFISDVAVTTLRADEADSRVEWSVTVEGAAASSVKCDINIIDKNGASKVVSDKCSGKTAIAGATLWWPYTHSKEPGHLYTLVVTVFEGDQLKDQYPIRFGLRTVEVKQNRFLLNGKDFYFTGFGKHEDSDIRGKGLDNALNVKDVNLIKWLGANSFRTSHYPYSEELMDLADELGIAVINEVPAVGLKHFSSNVLELHKRFITELIARDKNRPSVFMWSVANEPQSYRRDSEQYFREVVEHAKKLDKTRPITAALNAGPGNEFAGQFLDVIMFNKYASWYSDPGSVEVITKQVVNRATAYHDTHNKPVMVSEYGADTVVGLHTSPSAMFTEDYQTEVVMQHARAFDQLRSQHWFIGEHIWNFADFMTAQGTTRVVGNRKGILDRQRQPKAAAKVLRCRYHSLANLSVVDDSFYCPIPRCRAPKTMGVFGNFFHG